jgi:hypothetical protein
MKRVTRTERGWAGHFICAAWCRFRRNTLLECGKQRVVVSTVGNYHLPIKGEESGPIETIGHEHYYETMAFGARFDAPFWDADVTRQVNFEAPWSVNHSRDEADVEANANHEAVVAELTRRMRRGEMVVPPKRPEE